VRALDLRKEELAILKPAVPDHRQAGAVCRQRQGRRLREQPHLTRCAPCRKQGADVVAVCAIEAEIADLDDDDKQMFLPTWG
jgi:hypothetical protein